MTSDFFLRPSTIPEVLTVHSGLREVGNCPYRLIRPVLFACTPDQLAYIEDQSPVSEISSYRIIPLSQKIDIYNLMVDPRTRCAIIIQYLMLDSDEIWALHLARDFPNETVTPPTIRTSSPESYDVFGDQTAAIPALPNRLAYFRTRQAKEEALACASARLRERVQASRSDQLKRKTIFTGQTDYGAGSKKKKFNGSKSWGNHTPTGKTMAEKARQQVKKSAAVYANAVRAKASMAATGRPISQGASRTPVAPRPTASTSIFSTRQPEGKTSTSRCVVSSSTPKPEIKVVQVSSAVPTTTTGNNNRVIKPNPFPKPKPLPQPRLGPLTTPLARPAAPSKPSRPPPPPPPTAVLLTKRLTKSSAKEPSSLFIPKRLKPPPPQPRKSLLPRNHVVSK